MQINHIRTHRQHPTASASRRRVLSFAVIPLLLVGRAAAAEPSDSATQLREVVISGASTPLRTVPGGTVLLSTSALTTQVHTLGEADVMAQLKRLQGVSASSDYMTGISVDGNEPSSTLSRISGTPVFFPYRLGGIFSIFNTSHYSGARFERGIHGADMPNRIGGLLDMRPSLNASHPFSGSLNVGILASSATLKYKPSSRFVMSLSARASYIDQLYGRLLQGNNTQTKYDFSDYNFSAAYSIDSLNSLQLDAFHSSDRLRYLDHHYAMDAHIRWHNSMAALQWRHRGTIQMAHRFGYTDFNNRLQMNMTQMSLKVPSRLRRLGLAGEIFIPLSSRRVETQIETGYEISQYLSNPQTVTIKGYATNSGYTDRSTIHATEGRIYADAKMSMDHNLSLCAGVSATWYHNGGYNTGSIDPRITLAWQPGRHSLSVHLGTYHQYLQQTGLSEIGLATDSWYLASSELKPEVSAGANAEWLFDTGFENLQLSVDAYWRHIRRQVEYEGSILDLADAGYVADDHLLPCDGFNTGVSVGLQRVGGSLTGAVNYSYGLGLRHYDGMNGWRHARTDPGHTLKVNADYSISGHWNVGAQFTYASGRTYTPTRCIYVIAENLVCELGERNSARLPSYQRLDLSATYSFIMHIAGRSCNASVNLSLINAYGHKNVEMQTFVINPENGDYQLRRYNSLYRFLPSLSFTVNF